MDHAQVRGKVCSICSKQITADKPVVVCDGCQHPYHAECHTSNQGCATFGCKGQVGEPFFPQGPDEPQTGTVDRSDLMQLSCARCGKSFLASEAVCPHCGTARNPQPAGPQQLYGGSPPPNWQGPYPGSPPPNWQGPPYPPPSAPSYAAGYQPSSSLPAGPRLPYATFGQRFGAWFLDTIILVAITYLLSVAGVRTGYFISVFNVFVYYGLIEGAFGKAVGKLVFGIRVVRNNGDPIHIGIGIGRWLSKYISSLILGIGYLMALWTDESKALHDMMAGTVVIKEERS